MHQIEVLLEHASVISRWEDHNRIEYLASIGSSKWKSKCYRTTNVYCWNQLPEFQKLMYPLILIVSFYYQECSWCGWWESVSVHRFVAKLQKHCKKNCCFLRTKFALIQIAIYHRDPLAAEQTRRKASDETILLTRTAGEWGHTTLMTYCDIIWLDQFRSVHSKARRLRYFLELLRSRWHQWSFCTMIVSTVHAWWNRRVSADVCTFFSTKSWCRTRSDLLSHQSWANYVAQCLFADVLIWNLWRYGIGREKLDARIIGNPVSTAAG
jgi:hypothetical protein